MKKTGLLLVNLGSPASPSTADVKSYLKQFLNDPYVIDLPTPLRWFLVNVIILNTRPQKSAHAYAQVWTEEGSPLITHTKNLTDKLKTKFTVPVEFGMRYGTPSIQSAVQSLLDQGVNHIVFLPLYPQYSFAASETAIVAFEKIIKKLKQKVTYRIIEDFYSHPSYINALAESMRGPLETF